MEGVGVGVTKKGDLKMRYICEVKVGGVKIKIVGVAGVKVGGVKIGVKIVGVNIF